MRPSATVAAVAAALIAACANTKTASSLSDAGTASPHTAPKDVLDDPRVNLDQKKTVATVNGQAITLADLDKSVDEDLQKTTDEYVEKVHDIRKQGLEGLVAEKLVDAEAKAKGVTSEELLKKEVGGKVPPPTDAEIQDYYDKKVKPQYPIPLEAIKEKIAERMTQEKTQERLRTFVDDLRTRYKVTTELPELPIVRVEVAATGPSKGPADAKVTIVEFSDFECPYCGRAFGTVNDVMKKYDGKVRLVFRQFPLPPNMHPHARKAAEAALCANEQGKFWEMHDKLFTNQENLEIDDLKKYAKDLGLDTTKFELCLSAGKMAAVIDKDHEAGSKAGVNGTPAFFINGRNLSGAQPVDAFSDVIDSELAAAGKTAAPAAPAAH